MAEYKPKKVLTEIFVSLNGIKFFNEADCINCYRVQLMKEAKETEEAIFSLNEHLLEVVQKLEIINPILYDLTEEGNGFFIGQLKTTEKGAEK